MGQGTGARPYHHHVRIVLQRVSRAIVTVDGTERARIGPGLLLLVGVGEGDDEHTASRVAAKVARLRLFPGPEGREFDVPVGDAGGAVLVVSQFTLMGDVRRGNRPSWAQAARPEHAEPVTLALARALEDQGLQVSRGVFGAMMQVDLVNDGPVTLVLDSHALAAARNGGDAPG